MDQVKTETWNAFELAKGDSIIVGDSQYIIVADSVDEGDFLLFDTRDEDGELTQLPFGPFDPVTVVVSWSDDGSVPDEWAKTYADLLDEVIDSQFED